MLRRALAIAWISLGLCACGGGLADDDLAGDDDGPEIPGGQGEPPELAGITLAHNQARAQVQTDAPLPFLTWSPALAATAAAWVAQCRDRDAPTGLVDHNPDRSAGHPYYVGENIFASSGGATGGAAVASWVDEAKSYDYASNSCSGVCGHYTQVVWRDTTEVGCALGSCPGLRFSSTIVCDYGPGGNVNNRRPY